MSTYWQSYEGYVFNGLYPLLTLLDVDDDAATFRTEYGDDRRPATIHLFHVHAQDSVGRLANWRKAMALSNPSLLQIYEYGDGAFEDAPAVFVVSECTEDNLAAVLNDRPLTEIETMEVAETVSAALAYLHEKDLVHGSLKPAHVFAIENRIKLSSETISPADASNQSATDIWAFGLLILQCLTQTTPPATGIERLISKLPARLREIVAHSLQADPAERWTAGRIHAAISGNLDHVAPEEEAVAGHSPEPAEVKPGKGRYAAMAAVGLIAAGLGFYATKQAADAPDSASRSRTESASVPAAQPRAQTEPSAAAPLSPRVPPPVVPAQSPRAPVQEAPAPALRPERIPAPVRATPPPASAKTGNQFVVVATYNRIEDARKRAEKLKARWPAFQPEVYSVRPNQPPFLVIIGANLSKEAAQQLQRRARAAGMPRDTYFQSFNP